MMDMVRALGGSPTPMSLGEVYTAIQNNVVDGAENNWPSYVSGNHFEVAKYYTVDQHMAAPEMILVNTGVWNSFNAEEKKIIKEGALEGARVERAAWIAFEKESEATARSSGCTITDLTPEQRQLFVDALMPIYDQPAYAVHKDIIARIRAVE